jgi:hypothetical protein
LRPADIPPERSLNQPRLQRSSARYAAVPTTQKRPRRILVPLVPAYTLLILYHRVAHTTARRTRATRTACAVRRSRNRARRATGSFSASQRRSPCSLSAVQRPRPLWLRGAIRDHVIILQKVSGWQRAPLNVILQGSTYRVWKNSSDANRARSSPVALSYSGASAPRSAGAPRNRSTRDR